VVKNLGTKKFAYFFILLSVIIIVLCLFLGLAINRQESGRSGGSVSVDAMVVSTGDQAIELALPFAQAYAEEHDFDIFTTKAAFIESTKSYWLVEVEFKVVESFVKSHGYEVAVWADTGEIYHHGQMSIRFWPWIDVQDDDVENVNFSVNDAIEIALSFAQTYAQDHNRTIVTRVNSNCYLDYRPYWTFGIPFEHTYGSLVDGQKIDEQYWVGGYRVSIWADTGEIRDHGVIGLS
jgi:autonomous glycyl radical cofactor GrcA